MLGVGGLHVFNVKYLMPCKNTGNVVSALNEFADNRRRKISKNILENATNQITYTMIITKRKKRKESTEPEEKYIGFATNANYVDVKKYAARGESRQDTGCLNP